MGFKLKRILWKLDFIGPIPEIRILNDSRYKSIFSSLISIMLILFSIIFISYSFEEFVNQNPKVEYYKNNDYSTNKTFKISDSLLMFRFSLTCVSNSSLDDNIYSYITFQDPEKFEISNFDIESCKLGKNINLKYKELLKTYRDNEKEIIENFYCINYKGKDLILNSHPSIPRISERHLQISLSSICEDYYLIFTLVTESDFIDHTRKDNPIVPFYKKDFFLIRNENKYLTYNYQYIKYESDNGFIFSNKTIVDGIGVSNTNLYERYDLDEPILSIDFRLNHDNYDYYKREFAKFQSFLADIMSLINLLITISKFITEFLVYKNY